MNRDERLSRGRATAPAEATAGSTRAIYPGDIEGGTWIGVNEFGISFGLLNWNDAQGAATKCRSRGGVIPAVIGATCFHEADAGLRGSDLGGILPFRLIGIFPAIKQIQEWRWDYETLEVQLLSWEGRHWFSSSLSDESALQHRGAACESAWRDDDAGLLDWLRRLHRSHEGGAGPFSICVHRPEVSTVSYTEIEVSEENVFCRYAAGSPCLAGGFDTRIERERSVAPGGGDSVQPLALSGLNPLS